MYLTEQIKFKHREICKAFGTTSENPLCVYALELPKHLRSLTHDGVKRALEAYKRPSNHPALGGGFHYGGGWPPHSAKSARFGAQRQRAAVAVNGGAEDDSSQHRLVFYKKFDPQRKALNLVASDVLDPDNLGRTDSLRGAAEGLNFDNLEKLEEVRMVHSKYIALHCNTFWLRCRFKCVAAAFAVYRKRAVRKCMLYPVIVIVLITPSDGRTQCCWLSSVMFILCHLLHTIMQSVPLHLTGEA